MCFTPIRYSCADIKAIACQEFVNLPIVKRISISGLYPNQAKLLRKDFDNPVLSALFFDSKVLLRGDYHQFFKRVYVLCSHFFLSPGKLQTYSFVMMHPRNRSRSPVCWSSRT